MSKRAVCVGINDYPGLHNDLGGCVNDATDWASLLEGRFGFKDNVSLLRDGEATRDAILGALSDLVDGAREGDVIAFTFSGHGTWVPDRDDDEEFDNRDEAICAYDENIIDDELRTIIRRLNPRAILTVISDSCHSGTVTRAQLANRSAAEDLDHMEAEAAPKPRYLPPADEGLALRTELIPIRRRVFYPESDMRCVLLTGCNATEYSYDAFIGGRRNGAMTALAIRVIKANSNRTYRELHRELRTMLPSTRYPQSPQLEGSDVNKDRRLFE